MYIFLILTFLSNWAIANDCKIVYSTRPPSYTVDVHHSTRDSFTIGNSVQAVTNKMNTKDKFLTELVYNDQFQFNGKIIKKGTVVTPVKDQKVDLKAKEHLIKVHVLSTKNKMLNNIIEGKTNNTLIKDNQTGFLSNKSLKAVTNQDFLILKKDSILFGMDNFNSKHLKEGQALAPIEEKGAYKVNQCKDKDGKVKYYYLYRIIDLNFDDTKEVVQMHYDHLQCNDIQHIAKNDYRKVTKLFNDFKNIYGEQMDPKDLIYNEWGMVKLPVIYTDEKSKNITAKAYDNSFVTYKGADPVHSDTWGNPDTICQLMRVSKAWHKKCLERGNTKEQCQLQIGDISWITPGLKDNKKDPLGHLHHHDGTCIDIRPLRKDNNHSPTTINQTSYNSELTKELIDFLVKNGASPVYFNDQKATGTKRECDLDEPDKDLGAGVLKCKGHDNHIHFCFKPNLVQGCS